jgi:hypothetical protein
MYGEYDPHLIRLLTGENAENDTPDPSDDPDIISDPPLSETELRAILAAGGIVAVASVVVAYAVSF